MTAQAKKAQSAKVYLEAAGVRRNDPTARPGSVYLSADVDFDSGERWVLQFGVLLSSFVKDCILLDELNFSVRVLSNPSLDEAYSAVQAIARMLIREGIATAFGKPVSSYQPEEYAVLWLPSPESDTHLCAARRMCFTKAYYERNRYNVSYLPEGRTPVDVLGCAYQAPESHGAWSFADGKRSYVIPPPNSSVIYPTLVTRENRML